jgi:hypothetical protein
MRRISSEPRANENPSVKTVSFQGHAFSDGDAIHLKLPGGIVCVRPDAKQPSGHPYLYAALMRLFE